MPKKAGFDVRGEFLALQLFDAVGKSVTPDEINNHVGRGDYAAKYMSFLRGRHGFEFSVTKNGRSVISYTLLSEPDNAAEVRAKATMTKPAKPVKVKAEKKVKEKKEVTAVATEKMAAKKPKVVVTHADEDDDVPVMDRARKSSRKIDEVEETFGTSGSVGSYSVDADWDDMSDVNIKHLL
jgi:hypothetical protein